MKTSITRTMSAHPTDLTVERLQAFLDQGSDSGARVGLRVDQGDAREPTTYTITVTEEQELKTT
jgi:hypothetical protein